MSLQAPFFNPEQYLMILLIFINLSILMTTALAGQRLISEVISCPTCMQGSSFTDIGVDAAEEFSSSGSRTSNQAASFGARV
jgi:hypothetical protein